MRRLLIVTDIAEDAGAACGVQPGCRLVKNDDLRLHGDDARNGDASLLPAGEVERRLFQQGLVHTSESGRAQHARTDLLFTQAHVLRTERDIAVNGLFKQLILRILEHQPDTEAALPRCFLVLPDVRPVQQDLAGRRAQQAVQMLDERRFAGAGVPDDAEELPLFHGEAHVLDGIVLKRRSGAVGMREVSDLDGCGQWSFLQIVCQVFALIAARSTCAHSSVESASSGRSKPA